MKAFRRIADFFRRRRIEAEMNEEIRLHLEHRIDENRAAGMSEADARNAALRQFGGVEQVKETARSQRPGVWLEQTWQDLRLAARLLRKAPGFTVVAIASLALGIGANTAVFSLVNAILLASLPVPNPQELRFVQWSGVEAHLRNVSGSMSRGIVRPEDRAAGETARRDLSDAFSYPVYRRLRDGVAPVAELVGHTGLQDLTLRARAEPFVANGLMVSGNFFGGLGVRPGVGRLFGLGEDDAGAEPVAVISDELWSREYGRDPAVVGQRIEINGNGFTIVGVTPPGFHGVGVGDRTAVYVTMSAQPTLLRGMPLTSPDHWWVHLLARVRPGVSAGQLQAAFNVAFTPAAEGFMRRPVVELSPGRAGPAFDQRFYRGPLLMLLGIVGVVVLVACANLAGLSLARSAAREHELSVRAALGSGRWRLMRQALAETVLLAGAGGALGLLLAFWGKDAVSALLLGSGEELRYDFSLDVRVLGFTFGLTLITAVLTGILPAWRSASADPLAGLKSRGAVAAPRLRAGKVLVAGQVALAVLLLVGGGLYVRTLVNLVRHHPGFAVDNLLLFRLNPRGAGLRGAAATEFFSRAQNEIGRIPGVRAVTLVQYKLLGGVMSGGTFFTLPARTDLQGDRQPGASRLTVGDNFFATMGIPVVAGRGFNAADTESAPKVVVVNQAFVREYFPDVFPIGQVLKVGKDEWLIAGVCGDAHYTDVTEEAPRTVYFPYRQSGSGAAYLAVRTSVDPLSIVPTARRTIEAINPNVPLADITTQTAVRDARIGRERAFAVLVGSLAALAVLLACIGLYGLMAYNVARRTGEIGVRMALGARPAELARRVLGETLMLTLCGIAIGFPAALGLAQLIKSQLFGIPAHDPYTFVGGVLLLILVALIAAWIPARRAAHVDPLTALRAE